MAKNPKTLPDGMHALVHQFDMVHIKVKNQRVISIRPLVLVSETPSMPNIFTGGTIEFKTNLKFRQKLISLEGMDIVSFLKEVKQINYTVWREIPKVK